MPAASAGGSVAASCKHGRAHVGERSASAARSVAAWVAGERARRASPAGLRSPPGGGLWPPRPRRRGGGSPARGRPARRPGSRPRRRRPRPMTASADRISPRAAGSLKACLSAATPSGSPSSALAIPRGTGRRPFSTSRSQPGTCERPLGPAGGASSVPDRAAGGDARDGLGRQARRRVPGVGDDRPERRVIGEKVEEGESRGRPSRTTTRAAPPAVRRIERQRVGAPGVGEQRRHHQHDQTRRASADPHARRRPGRGERRQALVGGQRAAQVAADGVELGDAQPLAGGAIRRRSARRAPPARARSAIAKSRTTSRSAGCASTKTSLPPARVRHQQRRAPAAPPAPRRRDRARAARGRQSSAATDAVGSPAASSARRATAPPDSRGRRPSNQSAGSTAAPPLRR